MKILKNRFFIGALCIIAGLLLSFVAIPVIQGGNTNVYTSAVRMKETVQGGTQITSNMVETVKVQGSLVQGSVSDVSSVVGRYANAELYAGDYVTDEKLSVLPEEQNSLAAGTAKGKIVVSVTLPTLASGVSGRLLPGDIVTIIVLPKSSENKSLGVDPDTAGGTSDGDAVIYPELQYLEVCMVTASDGADADVSADPGKDEKNTVPATVSFYATEEQALKLAEIEQEGIIHLAFVARGESSSQFIPDAQRILNTEVK